MRRFTWGQSASSTRSRTTTLAVPRKLLPVLIPRRDDPQRLLEGYIQVIYGLSNRASVGMSHHVPGIIHEMQIRAAEHLMKTSGLFGFDKPVPCSVENINGTPNAWITRLQSGRFRN